MNRNRLLALTGAAAVLLGSGIWLSAHRDATQADLGGSKVFADLAASLADVDEVRLTRGDGSHTTLRKGAAGWEVVERRYPADGMRVRELVMSLARMKVEETKTSDPAMYSKLGVEPPATPTAASTMVEVVAGKKSWELIVGKSAEGRAVYVRKPKEAASALVTPSISVDPDQKRWVDRLITDVPGADVYDISARPASGPAYLLKRAQRGAVDLELSPVPKGRKAASSMSLDGQADVLTSFNFDDVRPVPAAAAAPADHVTYRLFDGQVLEFAGHRDADKAYIAVAVSRDPALAAQFAAPAAPAKSAFDTVARLAALTKGIEYEIPVYKYEALFKKQEDLLEKLPEPPKKPVKKK